LGPFFGDNPRKSDKLPFKSENAGKKPARQPTLHELGCSVHHNLLPDFEQNRKIPKTQEPLEIDFL
jgi:hypothetical protein